MRHWRLFSLLCVVILFGCLLANILLNILANPAPQPLHIIPGGSVYSPTVVPYTPPKGQPSPVSTVCPGPTIVAHLIRAHHAPLCHCSC
jgi:hypothetical protein